MCLLRFSGHAISTQEDISKLKLLAFINLMYDHCSGAECNIKN